MGILLATTNLAEAASTNLAISSEAPGLGLRAMLTPQMSDIWRSGSWGTTTINLDVDLGSASSINLVAVGAPRDGLLPGAGATVSLGASLSAAPTYAELQAASGNIVPGGGTYSIGASTTDLGAVASAAGGSGARHLGSTSGTGANVYIGRTAVLGVTGGAPYRFSVWARSVATTPTMGTLLTVDERDALGTVRRTAGIPLVGTLDATWRQVTQQITLRADTVSVQCYWAEGWQAGAEIEVDRASITRRPEVLDTGERAFTLAPFGIWAWVSTAAISARYLRLAFTGTAADAYLQLGRLWVGSALITARQASYGFTLGATDPGSSARANVSGVRDMQRGTPYRTLSMAVDLLSSAEARTIEAAALAVGSTGQVFAARLHSDAASTGLFGAFARAPTLTRTSHAFWRGDFQIEEDL